jgi:AraC-like DNA-binding protein
VLRLAWPELMRERFGCSCPLPAHGPVEPAAAAAIAEAIADLASCGEAGGPFALPLVDGLLAQLLFTLFRHLIAAGAVRQSGDALERVRALIDARLGEPATLDALARSVGVTAKHLTRAFKRRYGLPPVAYRRRAAMEQAATLVRSSRLPLAEIAARLGFDDLPYFTRVFRQVHGEPPGRFRRRHLGGGGAGL